MILRELEAGDERLESGRQDKPVAEAHISDRNVAGKTVTLI
jgi:hypothetical protein